MGITSKQIADLAGVSRGTVDRVLHDRPGVNPEVAERVRKIADEHGYRVNTMGQMLSLARKDKKVGFMFPSVANVFYDKIIAGIEAAGEEAQNYGIRYELSSMKGLDADTQIAAIEELVQKGCRIIGASAVNDPKMVAYLRTLEERGIKFMTINSSVPDAPQVCHVGPNDYKAGVTAAGMFIMLKAGKPFHLLIVAGSMQSLGHTERIRGFRDHLEENGIDIGSPIVLECNDDADIAYRLVSKYLSVHKETDTIFLVGGGIGGIVKAVEESGLDIRVMQFDDVAITKNYVRKGLIPFVICQEPWQQGYEAMKIMTNMLINSDYVPHDYITHTIIKIKENLDTES